MFNLANIFKAITSKAVWNNPDNSITRYFVHSVNPRLRTLIDSCYPSERGTFLQLECVFRQLIGRGPDYIEPRPYSSQK